ncbi:uncharacterized protein LOC125874268 [Solanum stenotomum]|uniref:uncharacterized protein LOC125874268 n=1 Tax=Solanum stenotomum TaxID=172797 RepID=UPI0020D0EF01|nr:uncharacterized protein LOC125874268 [Solanum stenotomum]
MGGLIAFIEACSFLVEQIREHQFDDKKLSLIREKVMRWKPRRLFLILKAVDGQEKAFDSNWDEQDVLLRTWISETMTKDSMYLIVGCSTAKEMWECFEEAYLQATKDKEFQLKQQLQNIKLGTNKLDEYLKEFNSICDGLAAIHKLMKTTK